MDLFFSFSSNRFTKDVYLILSFPLNVISYLCCTSSIATRLSSFVSCNFTLPLLISRLGGSHSREETDETLSLEWIHSSAGVKVSRSRG